MRQTITRSSPNKDADPNVSSMVTRLLVGTLMLAAPSASVAQTPPPPSPLVQPVTAQPDPLAPVVAQWNALRQSDALPFSSYSSFLVAHPGWPGELAMRRVAERAIDPDKMIAAQVVAFFDRYPPLSNAGQARYAEALIARGRRPEAVVAARKAWTSGALAPLDEARMLSQFGGVFTPADQDERMDRLLWAGATTAAARQLPLTSPARRTLFDARLAMRTKAPDAAAKASATIAAGMTDAGYIADRATWLVSAAQLASARALLAGPRRLASRPGDAEKWYEALLGNARAAATDGQWALAYDIARQVDDAYPPGTDVRDRPIGERDDYTSLVWLAGTAALNQLRRPADAIAMFDRYARAARSPQTQSKGDYWAGRAAHAAGRAEEARRYFEGAARHSDQFYGQLALERLGRPIPTPGRPAAIPISAAQRAAFNNREVVRAARLLGRQGDWQNQTQFVRAISASVETDVDHVLAAELAASMGRPDLAVMVGRVARQDGLSDYVSTGFPAVRVPDEHLSRWTMIHAIARQESQFDRAAISHAGARGLMQLMPGTAREVAGRLGMTYRPDALTVDTVYNIQLGSSYFQRMLDYFGGSYPLAVAAYNAGPGNVNKWLRSNGDPRLADTDVLLWIEAIPLFETRNYVQRVLENAVVYDLLNPERSRNRSRTPLSTYLGKAQPG